MPQFKSDDNTLEGLLGGVAIHLSGKGEHAHFQRTYRNDRVAFAYDCFPGLNGTLAPYQEEILGCFDSGVSRLAVRGPHGLGKTLVASILVHHSVLTCESDGKVPTTASAWRQLEKYLWPEVHKWAANLAWSVVGRDPYDLRTELLSTSIRLRNGLVEAFALASDNHELIEGAHATSMFYVFDEAKSIPSPTWDAAEGAFSTADLGDSDLKAFAISTPGSPSGRFYEIHMHMPGFEDWHTRHVTLEEAIAAGRISKAWAAQREKQWERDSSTYQNRVLGEFADDSEEGVIPRSWVKAAQERWLYWDKQGRHNGSGRRTLGVDVARMGEDATVIACRHASVLSNLHEFRKLPNTAVAGHVSLIASQHGTPYINIEMDGGYGSGVHDILKEQAVPLLCPVVVGARTFATDRSGELTFENVRSAMWWNLRELLDPDTGEGIALPPHQLLELDLISPRWTLKSDKTIAVESKKSIRSRIGRSTDFGDAACLAFWKTSTGGGIVI